MLTLFLDESEIQPIYGVGGFCVLNKDIKTIENELESLKERWKIPKNYPLKWSLDEQKPSHKKVKEILKTNGINPFQCRKVVLENICKLNVYVVIVLLQDLRQSDRSAQTLHKWAFIFLLQKFLLDIERKFNNEKLINEPSEGFHQIICDKPPVKPKETIFHQIYQAAYYKGFKLKKGTIPPLIKHYFLNTLLFTYADYCPSLQLADFCIGAAVNWAKQNLVFEEKQEKPRYYDRANQLFKIIFPKIIKKDGEVLGIGLTVYPPQGSLYKHVPRWLQDIKISEGDASIDYDF